jgi:membrane dipeptidase
VSDATKLHQESIVLDMTCPLLNDINHYHRWRAGGVTAAAPTVAGDHNAAETLATLARWKRWFREHADDLLHVLRAEDIYRAKEQNKLGIIFHFQNTQPIEDNLDLVQVYQELGVRMIQLAYNKKNLVGDGCEERTDAGLSNFGVAMIREMNRVGIIVDLTHTGFRTTMDAMEVCEGPVVFSHSNAKAVHPSGRNLTDEQIKGVAAKGGVIGMNGFPAFVSAQERPTLDGLLRHVDYIAELVGTDHIGIALDYYEGMATLASPEQAQGQYEELVRAGRWNPANYPPPPYHYPASLSDPSEMPNITQELKARGYADADVQKILGGNWLRVIRQVWK